VDYTSTKVKNPVPSSFYQSEGIDEKLLSDVVHKVKNGLGGIGGFAALLERDLESNDPRRRLVQRIQDGVKKINEFIVSLMTLVHVPETGLEKVKLHSLLKEVCKETRVDKEQWFDQDRLPPDFSDGNVELLADPHMIRNLFYHAVQFTNLIGGRIEEIKINPQSGGKVNVEFYFRREASSESLPENIFKLIEACEPIEARLSLAIVSKLVKLQNGKVSIISLSDNLKLMTVQVMKGN